MPVISAVTGESPFRSSCHLHRWRIALVALISLLAPLHLAQAEPLFEVSTMVVELGAQGESMRDVIVSSHSRVPLSMQVLPLQVVAPGLEGESRIAIDQLQQPGLQISPRRFVLQAGGKQTLRIIALDEALDQDRVYRALVKPDPPPGHADSESLEAYELLVFVRPHQPTVTIEATRTPEALVLSNTGNTNVLIQDGQQCLRTEQCRALPSRRIYAGAKVTIPLQESNGLIRYLMIGPEGSGYLQY